MAALAYFITFSTYGTWLHGNERGSVDREHNRVGEVLLPADAELEHDCEALMTSSEYRMEATERDTVLAAIRQHAEFRGWFLRAVHVRTNHVHIVVIGDEKPERMMTEFKAYASRALNRAASSETKRKHWTRHGSTRWLKTEESVRRAIEYTVDEQGKPMAVYHAQDEGASSQARPAT